AISLTNPGDAAEVVQLVQERVSTFLRQPPFLIDGQEFRLTARFGTAVYPADGNNAETLYANAEAALKQAKKSGERVLFYAPAMTARISEALTLENKLRSALEKNQFVLHYQPKILVTDRKIAGLEALIRWNDPEMGLVPPAKFIPLLEETGLILDVGKWALSQVARDCATWKAAGVRPPLVAVNVSPIQLRQKDFVQTVMDAFEKTEGAGGALGLEITESVIMQNLDETIDKLSAIRNLGVGISVDDFGTGYSSLAYIARLPIHELKVDRSFIIGITESEESLAIVTSIISLAHSLKLQVVAEGVETETQAAVLDRLGCDQLQGYLFSKPLPPAAVPNLISTR
ncbi:MAG TPA: GGDEF domain-containing phosphodiesterase, partial [Nitrospira sp.]|nr:GGDEF domain-containing phosphodiesterase [Nitrospira sp.]